MTEVVDGGRNPVLSLGEIEVVVAELGKAVESRWRRLTVVDAGVDGVERRSTRVRGGDRV